MQNSAFSFTVEQIRRRTKTVTRRISINTYKVGQLRCAIEKGRGLKKGETVKRIGIIRIVSIRREKLNRMLYDKAYGKSEVIKEGFPEMTPQQFVEFICRLNGCMPSSKLWRLEFEYV